MASLSSSQYFLSKTGIKFVNLSHSYCPLYELVLSSNQGQVQFTQQQKFRYAWNEKLWAQSFTSLKTILCQDITGALMEHFLEGSALLRLW